MIPDKLLEENTIQSSISSFLKEVRLTTMLTNSNGRKEKGIPSSQVFRLLFSLAFTGKPFLRLLAETQSIAKDTVYRFLKSPRTNWRKFLFSLSSHVVFQALQPLTSEEREEVLIIDDSLYSRARSKTVELLARVYDHVEHRFVRGFRMLTLGWSDGNSFVPLAFSLLSSENRKNRIVETTTLDKRLNGYKRRQEAMTKSTDVLANLLRQAREHGHNAKYVLFDSWFAFPVILAKVRSIGFHPVAMVKNTPKIYYIHNGEKKPLSQIYKDLRKKPGRAKILTSAVVQLSQTIEGNPIDVKLVFVRDRNRSKKWLALITTDIELSEEEVVRLYGKRWDIEVFFKTLKSQLQLGKEFRCRNYDSMVAHTSIVFARYIFLALEQRRCTDARSLGDIFYHCCDELEDITFVTALKLLLSLFAIYVMDSARLTQGQAKALYNQFIADLPSYFRGSARFWVCET